MHHQTEMPSDLAERVESIDPNGIREERILRLNGQGASARAHSQAVSERIAAYICELYGLDPEATDESDALAATGLPVHIKAAAWRVRNGRSRAGTQQYTPGRFRLSQAAHEWLVGRGGLYAFCVYEQVSSGLRPVYTRLMPADFLDAFVLDEQPWYDLDHAEGSTYRVPWPRVWPTKEGI